MNTHVNVHVRIKLSSTFHHNYNFMSKRLRPYLHFDGCLPFTSVNSAYIPGSARIAVGSANFNVQTIKHRQGVCFFQRARRGTPTLNAKQPAAQIGTNVTGSRYSCCVRTPPPLSQQNQQEIVQAKTNHTLVSNNSFLKTTSKHTRTMYPPLRKNVAEGKNACDFNRQKRTENSSRRADASTPKRVSCFQSESRDRAAPRLHRWQRSPRQQASSRSFSRPHFSPRRRLPPPLQS